MERRNCRISNVYVFFFILNTSKKVFCINLKFIFGANIYVYILDELVLILSGMIANSLLKTS